MSDEIDPKVAAKAFSKMGASKGGVARANALTPEERKEIARNAVNARWAKTQTANQDASEPGVLRATHGGPGRPLRIGELEIPCYVLEDGRRILSQKGMLRALGLSRGGGGDRLGRFLRQNAISPYLPKDWEGGMHSITFLPPLGGSGGGMGYAYDANFLADICEAVLKARDEGKLSSIQQGIALRCETLMRGFARVGIIALIDEATGYQARRPQDALAKILEQFISKELAKWAKVFPDEFYEQMFRLRGWEYRPNTSLRPAHAARLTNDLVYSRLAPGVLKELQSITPKNAKGRRTHKYHQRLTEDVGNPRLREHLASVITLMKASTRWSTFYAMINRALPPYNTTRELPFPIDDGDSEG